MAIELINGIELELQGGTRGLQGIQGEKGDPGNDYTPMIGTVDTLEPGLPATVSTNIDEEQNTVYFNFGIPKGEKGDRGDTNFQNFNIINGELIVEDQDGNTMNLGKVAMVAKGNYDNSTSYQTLDTVQYNDSTYMAKTSTLGNLPTDTTYWQLIGGGVTKEDIENKINSFDTLTSMKSADLEIGMTAQTLGYYTKNDGGGATYTIRAKTVSDVDNGGAVIILDNDLVAQMVAAREVNVLTWGVKSNDETTQSNLDALLNHYSSGNISIYFPRGNYRLTETLYLPTKTKIRGDGGSTTLSWYGSSNTYMISIKKGNNYCMIHDLCMDGRNLAYGIYDCDPAGTGTNGVRSKIFNLVMNNMNIGIRMAAMGSEFYNILCNGSKQYNDDTSIGFYITGTDNFINSCRVQTFGRGIYITGGNNRLFTVKTCVNGTGTIIENCNGGSYNIDLQENYKDNLVLSGVFESQIIMNNQNAGIDDHYLDGTDLQYSLLKMTNCSSINITGTLGARTKLGSGSCGNEKYAIYMDAMCTNITGNFSYSFRLSNETILLDKPLFYCVETETNKIIVNNEDLAGETTFADAVIVSTKTPGQVQTLTYNNNVITTDFKSTTNITNVSSPPNAGMFELPSMNNPLIIEIKSDTLYYSGFIIQYGNTSTNKFYSRSWGVETKRIITKDGCIFKICFDGLTSIYNDHLTEIETELGGPVQTVYLTMQGNTEQFLGNKSTLRVGTYNN